MADLLWKITLESRYLNRIRISLPIKKKKNKIYRSKFILLNLSYDTLRRSTRKQVLIIPIE